MKGVFLLLLFATYQLAEGTSLSPAHIQPQDSFDGGNHEEYIPISSVEDYLPFAEERYETKKERLNFNKTYDVMRRRRRRQQEDLQPDPKHPPVDYYPGHLDKDIDQYEELEDNDDDEANTESLVDEDGGVVKHHMFRLLFQAQDQDEQQKEKGNETAPTTTEKNDDNQEKPQVSAPPPLPWIRNESGVHVMGSGPYYFYGDKKDVPDDDSGVYQQMEEFFSGIFGEDKSWLGLLIIFSIPTVIICVLYYLLLVVCFCCVCCCCGTKRCNDDREDEYLPTPTRSPTPSPRGGELGGGRYCTRRRSRDNERIYLQCYRRKPNDRCDTADESNISIPESTSELSGGHAHGHYRPINHNKVRCAKSSTVSMQYRNSFPRPRRHHGAKCRPPTRRLPHTIKPSSAAKSGYDMSTEDEMQLRREAAVMYSASHHSGSRQLPLPPPNLSPRFRMRP